MHILIKIILILLALVPPAMAAEENLEICNAGGYFSGAQDRFMSGLAMHILVKQGEFETPICSALWKSSYDVGMSVSRTGKFANNNEAEITRQAANFAAKVYSATAKNMGF